MQILKGEHLGCTKLQTVTDVEVEFKGLDDLPNYVKN